MTADQRRSGQRHRRWSTSRSAGACARVRGSGRTPLSCSLPAQRLSFAGGHARNRQVAWRTQSCRAQRPLAKMTSRNYGFSEAPDASAGMGFGGPQERQLGIHRVLVYLTLCSQSAGRRSRSLPEVAQLRLDRPGGLTATAQPSSDGSRHAGIKTPRSPGSGARQSKHRRCTGPIRHVAGRHLNLGPSTKPRPSHPGCDCHRRNEEPPFCHTPKLEGRPRQSHCQV